MVKRKRTYGDLDVDQKKDFITWLNKQEHIIVDGVYIHKTLIEDYPDINTKLVSCMNASVLEIIKKYAPIAYNLMCEGLNYRNMNYGHWHYASWDRNIVISMREQDVINEYMEYLL